MNYSVSLFITKLDLNFLFKLAVPEINFTKLISVRSALHSLVSSFSFYQSVRIICKAKTGSAQAAKCFPVVGQGSKWGVWGCSPEIFWHLGSQMLHSSAILGHCTPIPLPPPLQINFLSRFTLIPRMVLGVGKKSEIRLNPLWP